MLQRLLLTILCITLPVSTITAQTVDKVLAILPQDAVACLTIRLQQIKQDQTLRLVPWEIISAGALDELGADVLEADRFDFIVGPITNQPNMVGVLTSAKKFDLSQLNKDVFTLEGKNYRIRGEGGLRELFLAPLQDNQLLIAHQEMIGPLLNAQRGEGALSKQIKRFGETAHVSFICVLDPIRSLLSEGVQYTEEPFKADVAVLAEKVQLIAARMQVDTNPTINVLIESANDADAQAVESSWNKLIDLATQIQMRSATDREQRGPAAESMNAYLARSGAEVKAILKPTRKGNRLLLTLDQRAINFARGFTTFINLQTTVRRMR